MNPTIEALVDAKKIHIREFMIFADGKPVCVLPDEAEDFLWPTRNLFDLTDRRLLTPWECCQL